MNFIDELKKEHEDIEQELKEIETIIDFGEINYPNLVHTLKKLISMLEEHEENEEKRYFPLLEKIGMKIPIKKIIFEHGELKKHFDAITKAINSGSDFEVKESLNKNGCFIVDSIRKHIGFEDEIIYRVPEDKILEARY